MEAIVDKERAIRAKNEEINRLIGDELVAGASFAGTYIHRHPVLKDLRSTCRLDAAIYSESLRNQLHVIEHYHLGTGSYNELGYSVSRGQNLQVSSIGSSVYSESHLPGFYRLVAPVDISEYRTVKTFRYLGNRRTLSQLKDGDVIFGAEGFEKGRVVILPTISEKTITNIHGIIFRPDDGNIVRGIFLGCYLGYLRERGIVDALAAGGSGGSLAIGYLHQLPIPCFPYEKQNEIARLYHNDSTPPHVSGTDEDFVESHRAWNQSLGIWELDREMKALMIELRAIQDLIIAGESVTPKKTVRDQF